MRPISRRGALFFPGLHGAGGDWVAANALLYDSFLTDEGGSSVKTDDFESYSSGSLPAAWADIGGDHTWTVEDFSGDNVLQSAPGTSTAWCSFDNAGNVTDVTEWIGRARCNGSSSSARIAIRFSGDYDGGTAYTYMAEFNVSANTFKLRKIVNGAWTDLASVGQTFNVNTFYWLRISAVGTAIKASWGASKAAAQASWVHEVVDSDVSATGKCVVGHGAGGSAVAFFDDVELTQAIPLTSPRTCEPGPGELIVVDTANLLNITGGDVVFPTTVTGSGDPAIWLAGASAAEFTMEPGKAGFWDVTMLSGGSGNQVSLWGFDVSASGTPNPPYPKRSADKLVLTDEVGTTDVVVYPFTDNTNAKLLMIPRSTAVRFYFVMNGILVWPGYKVWPLATTAMMNAGNVNGESLVHSMALLPLATYNSAWGGDWTEVLGSESSPAHGTSIAISPTGTHYNFTFTVEDTKYVRVWIRYVDSDDWVHFEVDTSRQPKIAENDTGTLYLGAALTDAQSYEFDLIVSADGTVKLFIDKVLQTTETPTETVLGAATSSLQNDLATNDIEITTYPTPALGIATDRVVCPQPDETWDSESDCIIECKNVVLDATHPDYIAFRNGDGTFDTGYRFVLNTNGAVSLDQLGPYVANKINAGAGTLSDGDDFVVVADGTSIELFVNGASIGSISDAIHLTGTGCWKYDNGGTPGAFYDHIACFPRDLSNLLPSEVI